MLRDELNRNTTLSWSNGPYTHKNISPLKEHFATLRFVKYTRVNCAISRKSSRFFLYLPDIFRRCQSVEKYSTQNIFVSLLKGLTRDKISRRLTCLFYRNILKLAILSLPSGEIFSFRIKEFSNAILISYHIFYEY